jgi:hypothetical protein
MRFMPTISEIATKTTKEVGIECGRRKYAKHRASKTKPEPASIIVVSAAPHICGNTALSRDTFWRRMYPRPPAENGTKIPTSATTPMNAP